MDRVSSQVTLSFDSIRSDVEDPSARWQLLLDVVANFVVSIDNQKIYVEGEFPLVEFASQAAAWLRDGEERDFLYVSMESEEEPLIGFYRQPSGEFRFFSPHQIGQDDATVCAMALRVAFVSFIDKLTDSAASELALDVSSVL